jgi:TonB family protein
VKATLIAAGLSIALHAVVLLIFMYEAAPVVAAVAMPREKPVPIEVMRLQGLVSPPKRAPAAEPPRAPSPAAPTVAKTARPTRATPDRAAQPVEAAETVEGGEEGPAANVPVPGKAESGPIGGPPSPATKDADAPFDTAALSRRLQEVALRCYPPAAKRFRQAGESEVRFCLDAAGRLREAAVTHSSGSDLLDRAASECVVPGAAPFGPETFGRCFTVPVRFKL